MNNNNFIRKERLWVVIALVAILGYMSPYLILGENATIKVHDNLDSNLAWVKILFNEGYLFPNPSREIKQVFEGMRVSSIYPTYDISLIFFKVFGMYWGYVVNKLIISVIGFFGMFLLLKKHILYSSTSPIITVGVSLLFALLPFWSFLATVSGIPLVINAFLNIYKKKQSRWDWIVIVIVAFYSSLILSGIFLIFLFIILFGYDFFKKRKINIPFTLSILLFGFCYLISHFPVFSVFFFTEGVASHREEFYVADVSFEAAYNLAKGIFENGQYHAHSLHNDLLLIILLPPLIGLVITRKINRVFFLLLGFITVTSFFYGFIYYAPIASYYRELTDIIPIQFQRFHFLHPTFWYILLAISFSVIIRIPKVGTYLVGILIIYQTFNICRNHELIENKDAPSFVEFYDTNLFDEIKKGIGKDKTSYKIINVGFHPSIAQFNGFSTLDGYFPNYPLVYKHKFGKIIKNELSKDKKLEKYFFDWGSRCYAFSSQLKHDYLNNNHKKISYLSYDYDLLLEMGCNYIFSSVEIDLTNNDKLKCLDIIKGRYWKAHIYEILE